jgi:hypothetical protein
MRNAVLAIVAIVIASPSAAQDQGGFTSLSFGVKGGLALSQHQGTEASDSEYTVASTMRKTVMGGVFVILPITRRFALQNEVLYVRKGSRQDIGVTIFDVPTVLDVTYDMDYLEIPLLLRYHWVIDRGLDVYSLGGFGFGLKLNDRYVLAGDVNDGEQIVPLSADSDMSEVDLFDMYFSYGVGVEKPVGGVRLLLEYRFDLSLQQLPLPTYAYVPFGEDDEILVENEPVPLRNQCHMIMLGIRF